MTKRGRPTLYTKEIANRICEELATGKSLRAICAADEELPAENTVRGWAMDDVQGFFAQYARARDLGLDAMADEVIEIADTTQEGVKTKITDEGEETTHADMIEHRKLRFQARQWYLSKLAPKRYGDRLHQELTGANGAPLNPSSVSDAQLAAALNALAHNQPAQHNDPLADKQTDEEIDDECDLV